VIGTLLLAFDMEIGTIIYRIVYMTGVSTISPTPEEVSCTLMFRLIALSSIVVGLVCLVFGILSEPRAHSSI